MSSGAASICARCTTSRAGTAASSIAFAAGELAKVAVVRFWDPDVVAIEDVAVWMNTRTALQMAEARGYLKRVVHELFPRARYLDVNPSTTKAAAGASGPRDQAKVTIRRMVEI